VISIQNDVNKLKSRVEEARAALFSNHDENHRESRGFDKPGLSYEAVLKHKEEKQALEKENFELKEELKRLKIEMESKDRDFQTLLMRASELEEALSKSEEEIMRLKEERKDENELKTTLVNRINELETDLVKYKKRFKDAAKIAEKTEGLLKETTSKNKTLEEELKKKTVNPKVKELYDILNTAKLDTRGNEFHDLFDQCLDELDVERKKVTSKLKEEKSRGMVSEEKLMISDQLLLHVLKMLEAGQTKNALDTLKERKSEIVKQLEESLKSVKQAKVSIDEMHSTIEDTSPFCAHSYKRRNHEMDEQISKLKVQIENYEKEKQEYVGSIDTLKHSLRRSEEASRSFKAMKLEISLRPTEQDLMNFLQCEASAIEELLADQIVDVVDDSDDHLIYCDL